MVSMIALSVFLVLVEVSFGASPLATPPRRYIGPDLEETRRPGRLSLPSRASRLSPAPVHAMSRISTDELQAIAPKSGVTAIGRHRRMDSSALNGGRWESTSDGSTVWRLTIHSPGALGIRLHFTGFAAGSGRLWVHDGSSELSQIAGPYAGMGPYNDGDFWSDVVMSDSAVIEYQPAGRAVRRGLPPFQIAEISHIFSDPQPGPKEDLSRAAAATCNLDSTCYSEWADTAKAVGRISFESGGGSFVCSGTLLNTRNNSGDLLFLTANHCIDTDTVARTLQAFWFYQTSACNGAPPSTRNVPRTAGSRLLVTGDRTQGDFSLVRLNSVPSGVMFSGWDPAEVAEGTALTVVHHPSGDYKRIAFGNRVASSRITSAFYSVLYSQGLTEGGSSGSGLFSAPLVLTGTLSNGPKADTPEQYCRIIPFADNYGRFSSFYPLIRDILEERSVTNPTPPSTSRDLTSGVPAQVSLEGVSNPTLFNGSASYRIVVPAGATGLDVVLNTTTPNVDVDLYVRFGSDVGLSAGSIVADHKSEGNTGNERITITPSSNPVLRPGTYFISFGVFTTNIPINATLTATVTASGPPPTGATVLTSGTPRPFTISAVSSATLINGGFTIDVPSNATRLEVRLSSSTPNVDLDLYVRYNAEPVVSGGSVVADHRSEGAAADELISITSSSGPPLRAGTYFIRVAAFTTGININATITATVATGTTQPPTGVTVLTSGRAQSFTITPQSSAVLLNGSQSYSITVPQGATRLSIVLATTTPNVDVDLFARFGADNTLSGGTIVTDHRSEGPAGSEQITITPNSSPALRAGTYFITLAMFTTGVQATGTLTATVTTGSTTTPPSAPTVLTSGTRQSFTLPSSASATLHNGNSSFVIDVGANATRLDVQLTTTTAGADVDLFVRFGSDPEVSSGSVTADYSSEGPDGGERITITPESSPALRPGRYFISLGVFTTNTQVSGSLLATVTTGTSVAPPPTEPTVLSSGVPAKFSLPAVDSSTLYSGNYSYKIQVPDGATQLRIQLVSDNPAVDVDLYARYDADTDVQDGSVVADYLSEGTTGNESITITSASSPPLRPGTYFISLGLFSKGVASTGTITATIERGAVPPSTSSARELTSGVPASYTLPSVTGGTLFTGDFSYRIAVGPEHTRLTISVRNNPNNIDVDLFARFGQEPATADGRIVADFRSTGDVGSEDIVISGPNLRAGIYFMSLALFTGGTTATGTITATLSSDGTVAEPTRISAVTSGTPIHRKPVVAKLTPLDLKGEEKTAFSPEESLVKQAGLKKRMPIDRVMQ